MRWNHATWQRLAIVSTLALGGCASTSAPTPGSGQSLPVPSPSAATAVTSPSAPASAPSASPGPTSSIVSQAPCPVTKQTGLLPSDRLVDLSISATPTHDLLTFIFAASSPGPAGPPRGTLEAANPPFSFAGSGLEFALLGQHAVQLRFTGMTIASESGEATYRGPTDVKPSLTVLREAIQYDASEGIVGWDVGYDGPGCVTLVREGNDVTVMFAHPEAPAG